MKCYYTEWIIEMGKDLLSNLVSARAARSQKAFHTLIKRSEEESINRAGSWMKSSTCPRYSLSSQIDSTDFKLTSNLELKTQILELNVDVYAYYWQQDSANNRELRLWNIMEQDYKNSVICLTSLVYLEKNNVCSYVTMLLKGKTVFHKKLVCLRWVS